MRILLIYPPNNNSVLAPSNFEPLALEVLAALVPEQDVLIFDMRYESFASLDRVLQSFRPDITGMTCNNTIHVNKTREVLQFIRSNFQASINIVGGHYPTVVPEDFFLPSVDYIFTGWAEKSFPFFIDAIQQNAPTEVIPGIITLRDGMPVLRMENIFDLTPDAIPFPNRISTKKYWGRYRNEIGYRTALVNTARGCPFRCSFCSVWKATRGHCFVRPAEDVFYELRELPRSVSHIFFADDNTFIDIPNAEKLCDLIRLSGIKYKYSAYCRSDTIIRHPQLMRKWKNIGLDNLCVGFEGLDDEGLKLVNKSNTAMKNLQAVRILHEIGIPFRSYFLIDPEFESRDFQRILKYVKKYHLVNPIFTIITPLPGTDYFEEVKGKINQSYDYFDFMHPVIPTRMGLREFYQNTIHLYLNVYSIRYHFGIRLLKMKNLLSGRRVQNRYLQVMPITRLLLLKILSVFLKRKLLRFIRQAA